MTEEEFDILIKEAGIKAVEELSEKDLNLLKREENNKI